MKPFRAFITFFYVCCFLALIPSSNAIEENIEQMLAIEPVELRPTLLESVVSKNVIEMLSLQHYQNYHMNPGMSSRWFNEYFKSLDYNKIFFLESDIEEFRSYESILWNYRTRSANVKFAYAVYKRYLQRVREWALFSIDYLKNPPTEFNTPDTILLNDKEAEWCKTPNELHNIWIKRCKNTILNDLLDEEEEKEISNKKKTDTVQEDTRKEEPLEFNYRQYKIKRYLLTTPEINETKEQTEKKEPKIEPPKITTPKNKDPFITRYKKNIARNYKRRTELNNMEILEIYLSSLCKLFDPHTAYMAPESKENFDINMSLSLQGIGAVLTTKGAYVTIVSIIPGGPADKEGQLQAGDRIAAVTQDGKETVDVVDMSLNKVVAQIRGPKGSIVHLTIMHEGSSSPKIISIRRDKVKLQDQEAQGEIWTAPAFSSAKERHCLTIYLPSFYSDFAARSKGIEDYKSCSRDVAKLIEKAREENKLDAVVLDLRSNGGGSLPEAVELAGLFLEGGPVVQVKSYNGRIMRYGDPDKKALYLGPLVVLVDKFSASASEIVASCLQDTGRAIIIGSKSTHGKGTVQNLVNLSHNRNIIRAKKLLGDQDPGSLKFTTAKFYRINGSSTQVKGVIPDIILPAFTDHMELGESTLPNVLPWDEITSNHYKTYPFQNKNKELFKKLFTDSLNKNPFYKEYLEDINYFAAFREIKELPLDKKNRKEYRKKEEKTEKMLLKFQEQRKRSSTDTGKNNSKEKSEPHDLIIDTTIDILMQWLSSPIVTAKK